MPVFLLIAILLGCRETLTSSGDPRRAVARWEATLASVVTEDGLVDYDRLEEERAALDDYVAWIERGDALARGRKKADRHAFWLNAFNALVMFQVLERGRPESVLDVGGWMPAQGSGFFAETQFQVGPDRLSLSEILHERIRMRELNYRDHAAINMGAMGGPPLRPELYDKPKLREQLIDQIERWLRDPTRGVRVDDGMAVLPARFEAYSRDFEFTTGGLDPCSVAARHVEPPLRDTLERLAGAGCPRRFADFDWRLNDAANTAQPTPAAP